MNCIFHRNSSVSRPSIAPVRLNKKKDQRFLMAASQRFEIPNRKGHKLVTLLEEPEAGGSSTPIVMLCHGLMSSKDSTNFPQLSRALNAEGFSCVRFDFSGNGESEGEFEFMNYTHEIGDMRSVIEFFRAKGREVVMIVGHSKAGNNVLLFASKFDGDVPLIVNLAGRFHMKDGIQDRFGEDIFNRLEVERSVMINGKKMTYEQMQERLTLDMYSVCTSIRKSKVLTIHGDRDSVIPIRDAHVIAKLVAQHELLVVPGAGHNFSSPSHAEQMISGVVDFLKKNVAVTV